MNQPSISSNIAAGRRFKNFWSNLSRLSIAETVSDETQEAIARALSQNVSPETKAKELVK